MPRLLLIEFAVVERFHRGLEFPYLQGQAKARGIPVRWVRFGVPVASEQDGEAGVSLSPEDTATAVAHADEFKADLLIFSHQPAASLVAALHREDAHRRFGYMKFSTHGEAGPEVLAGVPVERLRGDLDGLPGVPESDDRLAEADAPDFGFIPGNHAARQMEVLPFLFIGDECTWNRPFTANPFFQGLDLSSCFRRGGCSFCTRPKNQPRSPVPPMVRLERQLRRLAATCPTFGRRLSVRLVGEPVINNVREVVVGITGIDLPPSDLLVDSRADTLVRVAQDLRTALSELDDTGHRLHLSLIGIESFSTRELERLNKGVGGADNLAAVQTLLSLEQAHPKSFAFRQHGGLSLISYTPWTAPEELDLNLAVLEILDLTACAGKHLTGRARLYPGLPLELRARADGLLRDGYDDPLLDTARRTFYEDEVPWTFMDPVMEPLNRVLMRLDQEDGPSDPLTVAVRDLDDAARAAGLPRTALGHRMINEALRRAWGNEPVTPESLVPPMREAIDQGPTDLARQFEDWTAAGPPREEGKEGRVVPLARTLAIKPVSKIEPLRRDAVTRWTGAPEIPNPMVRQRPGEDGLPAVHEVFFGRSRDNVERAVALTDIMGSELTSEEAAAAYEEIGALLGYPPCCARAFALAPSRIRASYFWLRVANRVALPGAVPWELCPYPDLLVEHVPCSLDCQASLLRARGTLDAMPWPSAAARESFEASLRTPRMLFHEDQSAMLELIPEDEPGDRFRYRAGLRHGGGPDVAALAAGDELVMGPETLLVLRKGRPWASLSGRAFLWWHERAFQTDFWRGMVDVLRVPPWKDAAPDARDEEAPQRSPTMAVLDRLLQLFHEKRAALGGFRVRGWTNEHNGSTVVRLGRDDAEVRLVVTELEEGTRALWEEGPFGLSHPADAPLVTEAQWKAARGFRAALRAALKRLGHPSIKD